MLIQTYFNILKLTHNASVNDIHRAYRIRAKELHPDINTSPHAHNDFLLLQEAYNFLLTNYDDIMLFYKKEKLKKMIEKELYRDFIIRKKLEKQKPYFTQSKAGKRIFIGFHVTFILLGLAMVILPVVNILLSSRINEHYILVTSITFIGSVGIGFTMVWKLGHALSKFLITHKPC